MRLLFLNSFYPPDVGGGAEYTLETLAQGMVQRGHDVTVLATTGGDRERAEERAGVRVIRVPLRNLYWHRTDERQGAWRRIAWHLLDMANPWMAGEVQRVVQQVRPHLVSVHNLAGFSASAWRSIARTGTAQVQVLHDYYNVCARSQLFREGDNCTRTCGRCRVFRAGRASASSQVNAVIGVSRAVLGAHVARGVFASVGIRTVIHNARLFPGRPQPRPAKGPVRTFGFLGTLSEWKGIRQLLQAFARVQADRPPDDRLSLLVGGTGDGGYVDGLVREFGHRGVQFLGRVEPLDFFARLDASVVPSLWHDPLPGVVFESLLCGVPVIGARRGGIPEMLQHEQNGLLYEPDEPGALEACIRRLADAPDLVAAMSAAAVAGSRPFADVERMVAEHEAVYRSVLQGTGIADGGAS